MHNHIFDKKEICKVCSLSKPYIEWCELKERQDRLRAWQAGWAHHLRKANTSVEKPRMQSDYSDPVRSITFDD